MPLLSVDTRPSLTDGASQSGEGVGCGERGRGGRIAALLTRDSCGGSSGGVYGRSGGRGLVLQASSSATKMVEGRT